MEGRQASLKLNFGGVVAVVYSATRAVIVRETSYKESFWKFTGGGIESGEEPSRAAQRELEEESGVVAPLIDFKEFLPPANMTGKHYIFALISDRRLDKYTKSGTNGEEVRVVALSEIEQMPDFHPEHRALARLALWDVATRRITKSEDH